MKKLIYPIFTLLTLSLAIAACSGDSYQKRIDKQKKAIKNFLSDNGIEVLSTYPSDHKFKDNQYYLEGSTGVYLRVEHPGDLDILKETGDTVPRNTRVYIRFDSVLYMVDGGDYKLGNNTATGYDMSFTYGVNSSYIDHVSGGIKTQYLSPSLVLPIEKQLGPGAEVSIIVPFVNGSSYQMSYYEPFYYPYVVYHYEIEEDETQGLTNEKQPN